MSPDSTSALEAIKQASAAWLAAHERGFTPEEQDRFFEWLAADPRHGEILSSQRQVVKGLKMLAHWRPEHSSRPNPDLLASSAKPSSKSKLIRWLAPLGIAAALALVATVWISRSWSDSISSEPPIVRKVLEDGSTIDLNHGAQVEVTYTPDRRDVRLLHGEATFKVAKNPDRPFIVSAAGVTVRAVGTAFNVNLKSQSVAVLVTEGRVQVKQPASESSSPSAEPVAELPILEAGQRTVVALASTNTPTVESVPQSEMDRVLSWQPRQLEFSDAPLAQVAVEFNAGNRTKLVIDDPALASMTFGASIRSDNIDGFVRLLESNFHVKAERRGDMIILRRSP